MSRQGIAKISVVLGGTVLLAGCSGWSYSPSMHGNFMTEPLNHPKVDAGAPPAGGSFGQELAHDYAGLADLLSHSGHTSPGDWADTDYFARKGMAAERGEIVPPENNTNWAIPLEQPFGFRTQMAQARVRLVTDLDNGGRDRFPALAARAQVAYDCWLERTEDDWVHEFDGACHRQFVATLDELERNLHGTAPTAAAPAAMRQYNVYFEFDKSALTPQARQIVDQAADTMRREKDSRIELVGKADLAGTDPYNMALSHRRADTVRSTLLADGVPANQIEERWVGEREPPVPTAPGVREPRNRVVEITLQ
jgi:OmpA-OmpF porin, OOP family